MPPNTGSLTSPAVAAARACPFDLVARAELALDGCTRLTDLRRGGQPYFFAEFHADPPAALHAAGGFGDATGRLLEALTLARIMTGSEPDERDEAFAALLRSWQRADGHLFWPATPWTATLNIELEWSPRSALLAWTTRSLAADDHDALQCAEKLVDRLYKTAIWEGDYCWFPDSYLPENGWTDRFPPVGKMTDALIGAQIVFPLARFAAEIGSEQAQQLAYGMIRFLRERSGAFDREGWFREQVGSYFHSKTTFILGALKEGLLSDRAEQVEWARAAYDYAKGWGTEFGLFPGSVVGPGRWQGDACATADMIEIALLLGLNGNAAYLADAERFGRNHLLESQILDLDWTRRRVHAPFPQEIWGANYPPEGIALEQVAERALGGFASWSLPNDAFDPANPRLMQRATGSGVRALYALWHYAVTRRESEVRVNLHFSKDTRWATVTALAPAVGGVQVTMKTRGVLAVRVPDSVPQPDVTVNRAPRPANLRNGFVWLQALQAGDLVRVTWPHHATARVCQWNGADYTTGWLGDTLMAIRPQGPLSPLYDRSPDCPPAPPCAATGPVREIDTL